MDIRTLRPVIAVAAVFLCLATSSVYGVQENAVGGSVRDKKSDVPLSGVTVSVVEAPSISDTTRDKDGVYVLPIPKSLKKFSLIFTHSDYLQATDEDIANEQGRNKRPIVPLRSNKPTAVGSYSAQELDEIVAEAHRLRIRGLAENSPLLFEAGRTNLEYLTRAAAAFSQNARASASAADPATNAIAVESYEKSILIQQKVNPNSLELARTLEDYAAFSSRRGDRAKAEQLTTRATDIRVAANKNYFFLDPGVENKLALMNAGNYYYHQDLATKFLAFDLGLHYADARRSFEDEVASAAEDKFAIENASKLPNLEGTVILLSGNGRQYGRLPIPTGKSGTFKVRTQAGVVASLAVIGSPREEFDLMVLDEKGARIDKPTEAAGSIVEPALASTFNESAQARTLTVVMSNKTSETKEFILKVSAGRVTYFKGWTK